MKLNDHDLEILQATTTGKTIQFKDADGQWCDCTQFYDVWAQIAAGLHLTANDSHLIEYRVKPESDHIPDTGKMVWQPIETAPKDGTSILLAQGHEAYVVGHWQSNLDRSGWANWVDYDGNELDVVLFWQSLPEPPKE